MDVTGETTLGDTLVVSRVRRTDGVRKHGTGDHKGRPYDLSLLRRRSTKDPSYTR